MVPNSADWSVLGDTTGEEQVVQDEQQEFFPDIRALDEVIASRQIPPDNSIAPAGQFSDTESQHQHQHHDNVRVQDMPEYSQYYRSSAI